MTPDWTLFFGHFHPLWVHLPIGILLLAALLELLSRYIGGLEKGISLSLLAGAVAAGFSAWSGFLLASGGGYNTDTLFWHQWTGICVGLLALAAWISRRRKALYVSRILLAGTVVFMSVAGHLGGSMTHGDTYLALPFGKKETVLRKKVPVGIDSIRLYADLVQPVLEARCVSCHNGQKSNGDLDLSSEEGIRKGGRSGAAAVPGDERKSELIRRIMLTPDKKAFMPANGQPPLTKTEIALLRWWIQSGMDFRKTVTEWKEPQRFVAATYLGMEAGEKREPRLPDVPEAQEAIIRKLTERGILIRPVKAGSHLLDVSFASRRGTSPENLKEDLKLLAELKQQVFWLELSRCGLTDEAIRSLAGYPHLSRLILQRNSLTDKGISVLVSLPELSFLNVSENPLTDQSIPALSGMKQLKKLYIWQTQVTETGRADLFRRRPDFATP
ncbi:MAG: hypothetical protein J7576_13615 [Siphonobacter aquaeclarae]|nr:hypothetical protein [Siphonobacter aquaeclarae]